MLMPKTAAGNRARLWVLGACLEEGVILPHGKKNSK
jgi:hypothetical protein